MAESDSMSIRGVPSFAQGLQILLVDPDTMSLIQISSILEQYSYKVTATKLASTALSMIEEQKNQFKLVMANVNISDMDGHSFVQVLVKKDIPIMLMSSKRNVHVAKRALVEGACFFLEKPISLQELKYVWQHVYRKRRNPMIEFSKIYDNEKGPQILQSKEKCDMSRYTMEVNTIKEIGGITRSPIQDSHNGHMTYNLKGNEKQGGSDIKIHIVDENCKTMKINEEMREIKDNTNSSCDKMSRTVWNPELHLKFTAAICALGDTKARPKAILRKMNVPDLTVRQVASHLQKYKAQVQQICESSTTSPFVNTSHGILTKIESPPISKSYRFQTRYVFPSRKSYGFQKWTPFPSSRKPFGFQTTTRFRSSSYDTRTSLAGHFANKGPSNISNSRTQSKTNIANFAGYNNKSNLYNSKNTNQMNQRVNKARSRQSSLYNTNMIGDSKGKQPLGLEGSNLEAWKTNLPNISYLNPEAASPCVTTNFPTHLSEWSQNLEIINKEAPAVGSSSQNRPFSEYAYLLKILEEDPDEFDCFGNATDLADVEKYCEWLRKTLYENSTESQ